MWLRAIGWGLTLYGCPLPNRIDPNFVAKCGKSEIICTLKKRARHATRVDRHDFYLTDSINAAYLKQGEDRCVFKTALIAPFTYTLLQVKRFLQSF